MKKLMRWMQDLFHVKGGGGDSWIFFNNGHYVDELLQNWVQIFDACKRWNLIHITS